MIKGKNILITGNLGFIGGYLEGALNNDNKIVGLDKEDGGVTNLPLLREVCVNVDYIFHLGAVSTVPDCEKNIRHANDVNVVGTFNVLKTAKECMVKKVIFASSAAIYDPWSFYAVTKQFGENYCRIFNHYGLNTVVLRFFNVYGYAPNSQAVIPNFIKQLKNGNELSIQGTGNQTRDFIYVEDVVNAMIQAVDVPYGPYDIGTGKETSIVGLGYEIAGILKKEKLDIVVSDGRKDDIERSRANIPVWFKPMYSLNEGLKKTIGIVR